MAFIIFGSRKVEIKKFKLKDNCSSCQTAGSISLTLVQKYAHVFWIPFFPMSRSGYTSCANCKDEVPHQDFNNIIEEKYNDLQFKTKTKLSHYSLLIGIVGFLSLMYLFIFITKVEPIDKKYIANPMRGDIYQINESKEKFRMHLLNRVSNDSLIFYKSLYAAQELTPSDKVIILDKFAFKTNDSVVIFKSDLNHMIDNLIIGQVDKGVIKY